MTAVRVDRNRFVTASSALDARCSTAMKRDTKNTDRKLSFRKKEFKNLTADELARVKGGGEGEMVLAGEMVLQGESN
jgi:hypothetical protein